MPFVGLFRALHIYALEQTRNITIETQGNRRAGRFAMNFNSNVRTQR